MVITESELRTRLVGGDPPNVTIRGGDIVTPAARDFLKQHHFQVSYADGQGKQDKPEYMTHLHGDVLVPKSHPRIRLRGKLDSLQAKILESQLVAREERHTQVVEDLRSILVYARELLASEVKETAFPSPTLLGLDDAELRSVSHNPLKHFGIGHILPDCDMGKTVVFLNALRAASRETELAAVDAFGDGCGKFERLDLLRAFNRLSCRLAA